MRMRIAAVCAAAALALGACASIPTSGAVNEGTGEVEGAEPFVPFAEGPQIGDSVNAIVSGFIQATAAGFASDFSVAREYLTVPARADWDPLAQVTVYDSGALTPDYDEAAGRVVYSVPVGAWIDDAGRMVEAESGTQTQLEFQVARDVGGEWRISGLEDGSLLAEATFNRVFLPVSLVFATADGSTVVPELRWLPSTNVATWAARELVAGPSPWLANAVTSGFPAGSALAVDSVVVTDGVAKVQLASESAGTPAERALAEQQLRLTLTALPGVREVEVTVAGVPLVAEPVDTLSRGPVPEGVAAVFIDDRLGLWDGDELSVVPDRVGALPAGAADLATSYTGERVAFRVGEDRIVVSDALAGGVDTLVPYDDAGRSRGEMEVTTVVEGADLVAPTFDRYGWLWTAESVDPESVTAVSEDGGVMALDARWLAGRTVQQIVPSRDGARVLVVSRSGAQTVVEVAEVVRSESGEPLSIGEPLQIGANIGTTVDAIWVDDSSVALLGSSSGDETAPLWIVAVGGRTTEDAAVSDAVAMSARHGDRSITLVSKDGTVRERAGTGWSAVASGVDDLAYAG
ncbi:LpqB family beta-propeller domain-containing protein [Demequina rhizosphaerae]|uniref:LpqB family beta-propeller domain-containing protein n=1 Tax=Demequina rhizosphaerae TaxID=1638985 RepID=UPI0009E2F577|nr:LpqB family beta-propeller domain-containing protein [Demequina rhizosphaerae]